MTENAFINNALTAMVKKAAPQVTGAIRAASRKTGVDFAYLMQQAKAESSFQTELSAKTSSATGLFQFIEQTWLNMVEKHGDKHGMGHLADKVNDPAYRDEILDLRKDPQKAAAMAAELASDNRDYLQKHAGFKSHEIGATELYFAHFLGAGGAAGFLKAHRDSPLQTAADLFPQAAQANRNVFYDRDTGQARTLAGVYEFFDKKFRIKSTPDAASSMPQTLLRVEGGNHNHSRVAFRPSAAAMVHEITQSFQARDRALLALFMDMDPGDGDSAFSNGEGNLLTKAGLVHNPVNLMMMAGM